MNDCTPPGESISVDGVKKGLAYAFEELFGFLLNVSSFHYQGDAVLNLDEAGIIFLIYEL